MSVNLDALRVPQSGATPMVSVSPAGGHEAPAEHHPGAAFGVPAEVPAAPGSALAGLRERVRKARAARFTDLRIPGLGADDDPYDPEAIYLRLAPLSASARWELESAAGNGDDFEGDWRDAVKTLTTACVGFFWVDETGEPIGAPGSWPKLDAATAEGMGLSLSAGGDPYSALLRELFVNDADVLTMAATYWRWCRRISQTSERQTRPALERQSPEA